MKIAYFDCFSGISGDMVLGALVQLGVPEDFIEENVRAIPLEDFHLEVGTAERMNIHGRWVKVVAEKESKARSYKDIRGLIEESRLTEMVKHSSLEIFSKLAAAEAAIHNSPEEDVHFHELGGVDSIVDVVGTALGLGWLQIEKIVSSEIPVGKGFIPCDHGRLPVPAPATLALLEGVPVYGTGISHELVTPTGAAIVTSLAEGFGPMPKMQILQAGYGVGARKLKERPNLLRIVMGNPITVYEEDYVTVVETNIDDMNPEIFGFVMEKLFEDGALDVSWIPIFMKKNRPGTMMQVVCKDSEREKVVHRVLSETTATGVRCYRADRTKVPRKVTHANTSFGKVHVKEISAPAGGVSMAPEYEDCRKIALETGMPLKAVYEAIVRETAKK